MTIWLWNIHSSHNQFYRVITSCNSSIKTINVIVIVIITINVIVNVNVNVIVIGMVNVMVIVIIIVILIIIGGTLNWRSAEEIRLPPMWSGFVSRRRHHMWVELLLVRSFAPGTTVFPSPLKLTSISFWNARTPFNEFLRTPTRFLSKQTKISNF